MADDSYSRGRNGAGASGKSADPLSELARLIGQGDPFMTGARDRRGDTPSSLPAPQHHHSNAARYEEHGAAQDAAYDHRYADPHGHDQDLRPDQSYQDESHGHAVAYGNDPYRVHEHQDVAEQEYESAYFGSGEHGSEHDDFYEEEEPAPRRRSGLITVAALAGLAVIGTAGAFAYRAVFAGPGGAPPVIRAEGGPNKIVPAAQTTETATTKQIYDRMGDRGQNERVVSREEQPINIPDAARAPRMSGLPTPPMMPADPPSAAPQPAAGSGPGEPKKIRTVTIKADQPPGDSARPAAPPARAVPPSAPQPAAARPTAAPPASPNAPLSLAPQDPTPAPTPPPPQVTHAAAPAVTNSTPPPRAQAGAGGESGYYVQVSAQKTEEEAQSSFRSIQAKHASLLSDHQPVIRRKDLGAKGIFYGAQVGPLSREDAAQLCEKLKSAGQGCMVQRN